MVLGKIIAGAKLLAALSGQPDTAIVAQDTITQYGTIKTEQSVNSKDGLTREVVRLNTAKFSMDYATYPGTINTDVLQMGLNLPKGWSIGFTKLDECENDQHILSINKSSTLGNWNTNLSYGKGFENNEWQWIIGSADNGKIYALGGILNKGSLIPNDSTSFKKLFSGGMSATLGNLYIGAGVQGFDEIPKPRLTLAYTTENFASMTFYLQNPNNNTWMFKSQNALGNIDHGVFNRDSYNTYIIAETTAGPFIPHRLSTSVKKGNYTLLFAGNGNDAETNLELVPGMRTKVVDFGVGINMHTENTHTSTGLSIILNKDIKIGKNINGYVDAYYNTQTNTISAFAAITYNLTK